MRIIGLILTLILLFGITYVALSATAPSFPGAEVAVLIGFILLVANVTGSLVASVGLPRLTGYLIVGILAGPSVFGTISDGALEDLALIDSFALALIALMAGGELKLSQLRPQRITSLTWVAPVSSASTAHNRPPSASCAESAAGIPGTAPPMKTAS